LALDVYGGDPRIVAEYEEFERIARFLALAADQLDLAMQNPQAHWLEILPNPITQWQLSQQLPALILRIRELGHRVRMAGLEYFSTDARVALVLQQTLAPLAHLTGPLSALSPYAGAPTKMLMQSAAAFAVLGLLGKPSLAKTQVLSAGLHLAALANGGADARHLVTDSGLSRAVGLVSPPTASAEITEINQIQPARSVSDLAHRTWQAYAAGSSILVEVFLGPNGRDLVVYLPGTQQLGFNSNPFNIASNLHAISGHIPAASELGVRSALEQLKVGAADRVVFVGHSQGGLIAGNLASSDQPYQVRGLVAFGSPIAHLQLEVPVLAFNHSADPVPMLTGGVNPMRENWVSVTSNVEFDSRIDAHRIASYFESAKELDRSQNPGLRSVLNQLHLGDRPGLAYQFKLTNGS
jgi:hypothetical protein